jgi:hypothetical protein
MLEITTFFPGRIIVILYITPAEEDRSIGDVLRSVYRTHRPDVFRFTYTVSSTMERGQGILTISSVELESKKWTVEGAFALSETSVPCSASAELDLPRYTGTLSLETD